MSRLNQTKRESGWVDDVFSRLVLEDIICIAFLPLVEPACPHSIIFPPSCTLGLWCNRTKKRFKLFLLFLLCLQGINRLPLNAVLVSLALLDCLSFKDTILDSLAHSDVFHAQLACNHSNIKLAFKKTAIAASAIQGSTTGTLVCFDEKSTSQIKKPSHPAPSASAAVGHLLLGSLTPC